MIIVYIEKFSLNRIYVLCDLLNTYKINKTLREQVISNFDKMPKCEG